MKFKSALVTQVSGSIGGMTGAHNKGGMYFRARAIPTNPGSDQQSLIRGLVSQLSNLWLSTLTADQREAWKQYAQEVLLPNPMGDQRQVTALNHYIRSNVPRIQAGLTRVDDAPAILNIGEFTNPTFAVTASTDLAAVTFTNTDDWAGEAGSAMLVFLSRPMSQSIEYHKGPYRYAGKISGASPTPPTSPASITLPFGCDVGDRIFARFNVTRADGRLAASFRRQDDAA